MHLLLPLIAGILLICGLLLLKQTASHGVSPWTTAFLSNHWSAASFATLWFFGGTMQPWHLFYQPLAIALLFIAGIGFTFTAVQVGDVSIATPVLGVKVVFVALLSMLVNDTGLPKPLWIGAILAAVGIGLIQWTGSGQHRRILATIALAMSASVSFATFDILVQRWSPIWGAGRFLPITYAIVALCSWLWAPKVQWKLIIDQRTRCPLLIGSMLVGAQAICIVLALALYGDAVRVNIVYALRGLWGVLFAWVAAHLWGYRASVDSTRNQMLVRLLGAITLTIAVVVALAAPR
jgi:drug/metabolite transporter (DMT)-like permease